MSTAACAAAARNMNLPHRPWSEVQGVRDGSAATVPGRTLTHKVDPRGRDYYWIGGEDAVWQSAEGAD